MAISRRLADDHTLPLDLLQVLARMGHDVRPALELGALGEPVGPVDRARLLAHEVLLLDAVHPAGVAAHQAGLRVLGDAVLAHGLDRGPRVGAVVVVAVRRPDPHRVEPVPLDHRLLLVGLEADDALLVEGFRRKPVRLHLTLVRIELEQTVTRLEHVGEPLAIRLEHGHLEIRGSGRGTRRAGPARASSASRR